MSGPITIDFTASIFDGDRDYHWKVRPSADNPDEYIDLVYVEAGRDDEVMTMSNNVGRAMAEAIIKTIGLNEKPKSPSAKLQAIMRDFPR